MSNENKIPVQYQVCIYQQKSGASWGTQVSDWTQNGVLTFTGWLSESFSYEQSATYDTPFKNVLGNSWVVTAMRTIGLSAMSPVMTAQLWTGSEIPDFQLELALEAEADPIQEIKTPILNLLKLVTPSVSSTGMLTSPGPDIDPKRILDAMKGSSNAGIRTAGEAMSSVTDAARTSLGVQDDNAKQQNSASNSRTGNMVDTSKNVADDSLLTSSYWISDSSSGLSNQVSITIGTYLYFPSVVITSVQTDFLHLLDKDTGWPLSAKVQLGFRPLFAPTVEDYTNMFRVKQ